MALFARLRSEFLYLTAALRILRAVGPIARNPSRTLPDLIAEQARRHGDRVALLSREESLTYRQLFERSNQYARWALAHGIGKGDTVALMMRARPEYLAVWLGLARVGAVAALLNTSQSGRALAHSVDIVNARLVLADPSLAERVSSALPYLDAAPPVLVAGEHESGHENLLPLVDAMDTEPLAAPDLPAITIEEPALYIYTSGTTGMPKAAILNHFRVQAIMRGFSALCACRPDDRIYVAQPLYHTAGGVVAPGIALMGGGSCFIRDGFSASAFWDDIVEFDCTMFQYIGELCRYLLHAPERADEKRHRIRLANGNGLRPDIWADFRERFAIPKIVEWYAATEGNVTLFNADGKEGAIGRIPRWLESRFMTKLVRFDLEAEEPERNAQGLCTRCEAGEIGEAVGRIVMSAQAPIQRFDGYADRSENERKVLHDVFEPGDEWFRTGDLMRRDERGYFYFIDRIGDTFRWKGENVATTEVAEAIGTFPGVRDANVYGVEVPHYDGRAGMAALVAGPELDLDALHAHLGERLPGYARPVFLRLKGEADATSTFKQKKVELRRAGFDPGETEDALYFDDRQAGCYRRLDAELFSRIAAGEVRI